MVKDVAELVGAAEAKGLVTGTHMEHSHEQDPDRRRACDGKLNAARQGASPRQGHRR
jgi:hypothetical protein